MSYPQPPGGYGPPPGYGQGYGAPMVPQYPQPMMWTCPFCRYSGPPRQRSVISTAGWIIFFLCLFSCIGTLFCWVPLIALKRQETLCPSCSTLIGGGGS